MAETKTLTKIIIRIHITKITASDDKKERRKETENKEEAAIPFGGYGRT